MKQTTLLLAVLVVASSLFSGSLAAHVVVASTVNMFESAGQVSFSYTLSQKPTIPVSVNLQSSCLKLSQCTITFSPSIWNVSQSLTVYLDANSNFTCCPVTATLVGDPLFSGQQTQTNVCMISAPPSISQSSGDPHFRTFDGVAYSAFATGDFYLTREISGNFAVQVRQTNCGGTVSCNSAVAIKYQSCVLYVYTSSTGALEVTLVGNETSNGVQITQKSSTILFTAPTRMQVSVTSFARSNTYFLDMYLSAPSSLSGGLVGLAGYYDGKAANDFLLPNGTIASSAAAFNLGWQVATSEDLFLSSSATIPALFSSPVEPRPRLCLVGSGGACHGRCSIGRKRRRRRRGKKRKKVSTNHRRDFQARAFISFFFFFSFLFFISFLHFFSSFLFFISFSSSLPLLLVLLVLFLFKWMTLMISLLV